VVAVDGALPARYPAFVRLPRTRSARPSVVDAGALPRSRRRSTSLRCAPASAARRPTPSDAALNRYRERLARPSGGDAAAEREPLPPASWRSVFAACGRRVMQPRARAERADGRNRDPERGEALRQGHRRARDRPHRRGRASSWCWSPLGLRQVHDLAHDRGLEEITSGTIRIGGRS
jgi:hypothetical protein